jgi:hypothetical protein
MYGSDAMAGVINDVLKKEFCGTEVLGSYSANEWGAGAIKRGSLTFGFGSPGAPEVQCLRRPGSVQARFRDGQ